MGFLQDLFKSAAAPQPANPQRPIPAPAAAPVTGTIPYGIDQRPRPVDDQLDTLTPQQVGAFRRGKITDGAGSPGVRMNYVNYTKAGAKNHSICVGIFVHATAAEAQQAQQGQCQEDPGYQSCQHRFGTDPSFFRNPNTPEGGYFYFTRDRFGFQVQAWQGAADLDAFMAAFPY